MIRAILFDLDKTLYPCDAGLQEAGDVRITEYMAATLGMPVYMAEMLRLQLWADHGTTARGLEVEYGLAQAEIYRQTIETLDPCDFMAPDPRLAAFLRALPYRKLIFTNSTLCYAERVLAALGIAAEIEGILHIEWMDWLSKPHPQGYERALAELCLEPEEVMFVDDRPENLAPADEMGMVTVLVGDLPGEADFRVESVFGVGPVLQALEGGNGSLA